MAFGSEAEALEGSDILIGNNVFQEVVCIVLVVGRGSGVKGRKMLGIVELSKKLNSPSR